MRKGLPRPWSVLATPVGPLTWVCSRNNVTLILLSSSFSGVSAVTTAVISTRSGHVAGVHRSADQRLTRGDVLERISADVLPNTGAKGLGVH
jgi:hypothetical protein